MIEGNAQSLKGQSVLVFSKTKGFRHSSIENGKQMFLEMAAQEKFKVDTTEDASIFNTKSLKKYDVVVFLSTTGDVLNEEQQNALIEFMQKGKSFLGIHAATDTEYDWPWFNKLVGAYFQNHPKPQQVTYINLDSTNISVSHWPGRFNRLEEIYNFKSMQPEGLHYVLAADENSYTGGTMPEFHPAAWCHSFGGGKAYYTALGHHPETYADPDFRKHILGALQWLVAE